MLPKSNRLTRSEDFSSTVKSGVRAGKPTVVVHMRKVSERTSRVGFVVSKSVGNAVTRNKIKRKLRHLCRPIIDNGNTRVDAVVRALPLASQQTDQLSTDLAKAWKKCLARLGVAEKDTYFSSCTGFTQSLEHK